ncbi:MAG: hypothetical protein Q8M22_01280 [Actinomycetota bacterium]|nr:hypothetical protein [Actinomycetota bacterium]
MTADDARSVLFRALVAGGSLDDLVRDPDDVSKVALRMRPLRARTSIEVASFAVNGDRVDVTARSGDDEWRVVFASADGARVDWLEVFHRPPAFSGVTGGLALVVNGPSSAGKSSVLREVRAHSAIPWVVFDEPMFGLVDVEYLIWRDRAEVLHRGFLDGMGALALAGNCVATSAGGHPQSWFDAAFAGVPTLRVGLDCNSVELARRERGRRDVPGGWAHASLTVHEGWQYHLRFDTAVTDAAQIATQALEVLSDWSP